jgi:hypothetical protein
VSNRFEDVSHRADRFTSPSFKLENQAANVKTTIYGLHTLFNF